MPKVAPCLRKLLNDATLKWPDRNRASDGLLPSTEHHKQNPTSDHETGNAADLTHDPAHGVDCSVLSRQLIDDPRVKYIIFNRQIYRTYKRQLGWAVYSGKNPHVKHMHVSIYDKGRNDLSPWPWSPVASHPQPAPAPAKILRRGDRGPEVEILQFKLGVKTDSIFGFVTEKALKNFQLKNGLIPDGIYGPKSRAKLEKV